MNWEYVFVGNFVYTFPIALTYFEFMNIVYRNRMQIKLTYHKESILSVYQTT